MNHLITNTQLQKFNELLQQAILLDGAEKGNIQIYEPATETLSILVQQGFKEDFLEYFKVVKAFDASACGRAIGTGNPVIINDVNIDIAFVPHRDIAMSAEFRAVKSVPVVSDKKVFFGILSTHFEKPQSSWDLGKLSAVVDQLKVLFEEATADRADKEMD